MPDPTPFELSFTSALEIAEEIVQDLDDRISALTPDVLGVKSFDPIKSATKLKRDADALILTMLRDSLMMNYHEEMGEILNGPVADWKPGDSVPAIQNNMVLRVDTRQGPGVLVINESSLPEGLGKVNLSIKDTYNTFRKNPLTVIFGTLDDSGYYVGSWHVNTLDEDYGYGRVDLHEPGSISTFILVEPDTLGLPPADYSTYMVVDLPDMGNLSEGMFFNGAVSDYVTSDGASTTFKEIQHVDGSRSIFGKSFADGNQVYLGLADNLNLDRASLIISGRPDVAGYVPGVNEDPVVIESIDTYNDILTGVDPFQPMISTFIENANETQDSAAYKHVIYELGQDPDDANNIYIRVPRASDTVMGGSFHTHPAVTSCIDVSESGLTDPYIVDALDTVVTAIDDDGQDVVYRMTTLVVLEGWTTLDTGPADPKGIELLYITVELGFQKVDGSPDPTKNDVDIINVGQKVISYSGEYSEYSVAGRLIEGKRFFDETGGDTHTWVIESNVYNIASGDWSIHFWTEDFSDVLGPQGTTNPNVPYTSGSVTPEAFGNMAYTGYFDSDVSRYGNTHDLRSLVFYSTASGLKYYGVSYPLVGSLGTMAGDVLCAAGDDFDETLKLYPGSDGLGVIGIHGGKVYYLFSTSRYVHDLVADKEVVDAVSFCVGSYVYVLVLANDSVTPANDSTLYLYSLPSIQEHGYNPPEDEYPMQFLGSLDLTDGYHTKLSSSPINNVNRMLVVAEGDLPSDGTKTLATLLNVNALDVEYSWMLRLFDHG